MTEILKEDFIILRNRVIHEIIKYLMTTLITYVTYNKKWEILNETK